MSTDASTALLDLPDDPAALKQMVVSLACQREERDQRIAALEEQRQQLEQRRQQLDQVRQQLELENLRLGHRLAVLLKRYYGPRADRVDPAQLVLEFAAQLEARPVPALPEVPLEEVPGVRRVRRGRRNLAQASHLPTIQRVQDLTPQEQLCPCCHHRREKIGQEVTYTIEWVPGHFQRIEKIRIKYGCALCDLKADNPQIVCAPKAPAPQTAPIDKGLAGPGLLAYVVTAKYADYLPLYRLQGIFERAGLELNRSTLSVWCQDVAELVQPVYERMVQRVLASHVIHTDDTVMPLLAPGKAKQARMWVYVGDPRNPYNVFEFTLNRSRDGPAAFLGNAFHGTLQADAYGGYDGICMEGGLTQAGCWAHARRKFVECQDLDPAITGQALGLIQRLFAVEQQAKGLSAADHLALRQAHSRPVLEVLYPKLQEWKQRLLPKHPVAPAVGYVLNQWQPLTVFLGDPEVDVDNNVAEREMKRIALNRKNSLFVASERGGQTAAVLSSITSTCRRHGVDSQVYLTQLLVNLPDAKPSELDDWLPDTWKNRQAALPPIE